MNDPQIAQTWVGCLLLNQGDKNKCLQDTTSFVVNEATVGAVLILLAVSSTSHFSLCSCCSTLTSCLPLYKQMNGIWLLILLGRWSMVTGWYDLVAAGPDRNKREFVSVDARMDDLKKDTRSYEMLSRDREGSGKPMDALVTTPLSAVTTPLSGGPTRGVRMMTSTTPLTGGGGVEGGAGASAYDSPGRRTV